MTIKFKILNNFLPTFVYDLTTFVYDLHDIINRWLLWSALWHMRDAITKLWSILGISLWCWLQRKRLEDVIETLWVIGLGGYGIQWEFCGFIVCWMLVHMDKHNCFLQTGPCHGEHSLATRGFQRLCWVPTPGMSVGSLLFRGLSVTRGAKTYKTFQIL